MAVSPPPKKEATDIQAKSVRKVSERQIDEIINRGGSATTKPESQPETIKQFNIRLMSGKLDLINSLRAKRTRKPTSPKLGVSLEDWILEAIESKIEKEKKEYGIR